LPASLSESAYAEALLDLCAAQGKPVLLPAGGRTVMALSHRREAFAPLARFLASEPGVPERVGDKLTVSRLAASLGIPVPEPIPFDEAERIDQLAERLPYPVVLRYRDGERLGLSSDRRSTVAGNPRAFVRRYNVMHDVQPPVLLQAYVPGRSRCVSALMDGDGRAAAVFCFEFIQDDPTTGGTFSTCRSDWFPVLAERTVRLLSALSFTGFATAAFKGDAEEDARLLDLTPRLWDSYPLSCLSGAGLAEAYVRAVLGAEAPLRTTCRYRCGVRTQYFFDDAGAALRCLRHGRADLAFHAAADMFAPEVKGCVLSPKDLRGSLYYLLHPASSR
jgi:predicted ATP-grasp superfamily ATP-dependent carboligase